MFLSHHTSLAIMGSVSNSRSHRHSYNRNRNRNRNRNHRPSNKLSNSNSVPLPLSTKHQCIGHGRPTTLLCNEMKRNAS